MHKTAAKPEREAQCDAIIRHMRASGSISPAEAFSVHNIYRLAARIKDLRNLGYRIRTSLCTDPNGKRYARYTFIDTAYGRVSG